MGWIQWDAVSGVVLACSPSPHDHRHRMVSMRRKGGHWYGCLYTLILWRRWRKQRMSPNWTPRIARVGFGLFTMRIISATDGCLDRTLDFAYINVSLPRRHTDGYLGLTRMATSWSASTSFDFKESKFLSRQDTLMCRQASRLCRAFNDVPISSA